MEPAMPQPKDHEELLSKIIELKKRFPQIGICCFQMPLNEVIEIFKVARTVIQFKPKTVEDMGQIFREVKAEKNQASLHLPNLRYDEQGLVLRKAELLEMLKQKLPENMETITIHLGWKDTDLVLDHEGKWQDNLIANNVKGELADIFRAGFQSGKFMTIENLRYKPFKHSFRELFGSRSEHLILTRNLMAQALSKEIGIPAEEILKRTGYTLDVGHASGNAHLNEEYPLEAWLKTLGPDIKVIHLHDMLPVEENGVMIEQTHMPLGDGIVDWKKFFAMKDTYCPLAPMVIELPEDHIIKSIDFLLRLK